MTWAQKADPFVTQQNIAQTICVRGYAGQVRPPMGYTNRIKNQLLDAHHIPRSQKKLYELDHIIPLEAGGSPSSLANLQLQLWDGPRGAHVKDYYENLHHRLVCSGKESLIEAQNYFATQWTLPQ